MSEIPLADELNSMARKEQHPAAWREIVRWLESRSVHELRELARHRGASPHTHRKTELIAELVGLLANPESVHQVLAALHEGEKATLELVYLLAGHESLRQDAIQKALLAWYGPILSKDSGVYLDSLVARGLLFAEGDAKAGAGRYRIPKAVSICLTSLSKRIDTYPPEQTRSFLPKEVPASLLLEAVSHFWQYVRDHQMKVHTAPLQDLENAAQPTLHQPDVLAEIPAWLSDDEEWQIARASYLHSTLTLPLSELQESDVQALAEMTGCSRDMLDFVYHLLLDLGLLTKVGDSVEVNQLAIERYHKHGEIQRLQALVSAWLAMKDWNELSLVLRRAGHLHLRRIRGTDFDLQNLYEDLAYIRQFMARLLSLLSDDHWHSLDALLEAIWQLCPDLSCICRASRTPTPQWWLDSSLGKQPPTPYDKAEWLRNYGPLFAGFVEGPFSWSGSVSLAYEGSKLVAFRLTSLGKYLLGRYPQIAAGKGDMRPMTIGDDLTINVQLGRVDTEVHDFLGQFADLMDAESDVFRYRVTPQRLNQAFENGMELKTILSFLETVSGAAVPVAACRTLEEWWQNYGSVRLYENPTVIEFADEYTLQELLNTTSLAEQIIYQLSPCLVVIKPESVDTLMAEMVRKGYTPKMKETLS